MVFVSLPFLLVFFPLCMLLYFTVNGIKAKNIVLLIFSLIFYSWGEPKYILLLLLMSFADWMFALLMEKHTSRKKLFLILACVVNLGLIGIFKYGVFVLTNFNHIFGVPSQIPEIALPIGISFYTFQLLSYVVDVYRGDVKAQPKFHIVLLYASLFHQCIAGPIVRYRDVERQLLRRQASAADINTGINRFCVGLAKKAVLSNMCGSLVEALIIPDNMLGTADAVSIISQKSALSLWLGMLMFALQIYLDFSAYSDMAIGMGRMIGIQYKENFDYPYMSRSVSEFWRRWHISLGSFFRDYVYIPLGGNRKGKARTYLNLFVVWALTGLWHGASWNYIFWGLYFFVFIVLEKAFLGKLLEKVKILSNIYLIIVVYFGWILFKFESMGEVAAVFRGMFGLNSNAATSFETATVFKSNVFFIIVACIAVCPIVKAISTRLKDKSLGSKPVMTVWSVATVLSPAVLIFISFINIVGSSYNPFLYFQF